MEEPRKEEQAQEKVDPQPVDTVAPSPEPVKSGSIEEKKETTASVDDVKETIDSETKTTPSKDLSASVEAIIAHLNEGLEVIQKVTGEPTALSTEKVAELNGLKSNFTEQLKRIQEEQTSLVSTEHSAPRKAQFASGLETYDQELQSVLEKLNASLPTGQTGNETQTTTFIELATSLDAVFKTTLTGFQSLPPDESNNAADASTKGKEPASRENAEGTIVLAGPEGEIIQDRRTPYLTLKSTGSVTVIGKDGEMVENTLIQTDPVTQELLDRVGYVQLITEACDQGPFTDLVTTKQEGEEGEDQDEDKDEEKDKTQPEPAENGTWFELVVMTKNLEIPDELLKEEHGPDDVVLSQETKDVLIRVLYGGRYIPKSRPKPGEITQATSDNATSSSDAPSSNAGDSQQPNAPTRRLTQFGGGEATEEPSQLLRFKSHDNQMYVQPAVKIMGPMISKSHELWKYLEVGDVLGVMACARGARWKNEVTSVDLRFWKDND